MENLNLSDFQSNGYNPSVYVGTYRKYNEGSLYGMWVDLVACGNYDTFIEVCHKLHADESDPELMFQDYENFPEKWYSESCMDEDTFENFEATVLSHEIDHLDGILHMDIAEQVLEMNAEERTEFRKEHPYEIISKTGKYNLPKKRVKKYEIKNK